MRLYLVFNSFSSLFVIKIDHIEEYLNYSQKCYHITYKKLTAKSVRCKYRNWLHCIKRYKIIQCIMLYRCTCIYILRGCMTIYFENRKNTYLFLHVKSQVLEDRTDRPPINHPE